MQAQAAAAAYNQPYGQGYDQTGYGGQQDIGPKARIINLIGAVRTLMRSESIPHPVPSYLAWTNSPAVPLIALNLIIIAYELIRVQ